MSCLVSHECLIHCLVCICSVCFFLSAHKNTVWNLLANHNALPTVVLMVCHLLLHFVIMYKLFFIHLKNSLDTFLSQSPVISNIHIVLFHSLEAILHHSIWCQHNIWVTLKSCIKQHSFASLWCMHWRKVTLFFAFLDILQQYTSNIPAKMSWNCWTV